MKKFLIGLLIFALAFVGCFFGFKAIIGEKEEPTDGTENNWSSDGWVGEDYNGNELGEFLSRVNGNYALHLSGEAELAIAKTGYTTLGTENVKSITIEGEDGATIRATGEGKSKIMANGNGTLVIRNVTIVDETQHKGTYYWDYLSFGGKVEFENCVFSQSIKLLTETATLKNCSFHSPWNKYYSVWVSNGNVTFDGCTFTGYRALKIHEYEGDDITTVTIDGCTFTDLVEKPGLAIGTFIADPANTTVEVKNSSFVNCHAWDTVGSIEGVDGFYEADMYTNEFNFIEENNTVNGEVVNLSRLWRWKVEENELTPVWIW